MTEKILVIDDSTTIQKVVKIACEPYSVQVACASSYLEAISETNQGLPDLVIADASLPGIKGADDYAQLQKRLQGVPFVILQGSYEEVDVEAFESAGFQSFLKKPFEAQVLIEVIEAALGRSIQAEQALQQVSNGMPASSPRAKVAPLPPPPPVAAAASPSKAGFSQNEPSFAKASQPKTPPPPPISLSLGDLEEAEEADGITGADPISFAGSDRDMAATDHDTSVGFDDDSFDLPEEDDRLEFGGSTEPSYNKGEDFEVSDQAFAPPPPPPMNLGMDDDDTSPESEQISAPKEPVVPKPPSLEFSHQEPTNTKPQSHLNASSADASFARQEASGLVEPFLREELAALVRQTVLDYCDRHFSQVAREIISEEIKKLTEEKARLLIDK